jgi:hypothetical protein
MHFSLSQPLVATTLCGTASVTEITQAVKYMEEFYQTGIDKEFLAEVLELLKPIKNYAWIVGKEENNEKISM